MYPKDVFPGVWDKLDDIASSGLLLSSELVLKELQSQDDVVLAWAKKNVTIFLPLDTATQTQAKQILKTHQNLVDLKKRKSGADPFVVAAAMVNSCVVVTEEKPSGGPQRSKIPDVCKAYKVECIPILEMFRREGLRLMLHS